MSEVLSPEAADEGGTSGGNVVAHPAWAVLKQAVEAIRPWQQKDGSIDFAAEGAPGRDDAQQTLERLVDAVEQLPALLPHDADYHRALAADLRRWAAGGFAVPDFLDSLLAFQPAAERRDGRQHVVVFPMYTQNGNPDRNLEAVALRVVWPEWLAELERTRYDNPLFVPITFEDFTPGYDTNSAVLFPETVAVRATPERWSWGAIFCDRVLDWYTVSIAFFAAVLLAAHGATYLVLKTEGAVHDRSATLGKYLWAAVVPLFLGISVESWVIRPDLPGRAIANPFCWLGLLMIIAAIVTLISGLRTQREMRAFIGSNFLIVGLLATGSAAIFPVMLYSTLTPQNSLTAYAVASSRSALVLALVWCPVGFALALVYFLFISRRYAGKVSVGRDNQGFY